MDRFEIKKIDKKLSAVAVRSRDKLPYTVNSEGVYDDHKNNVQLWTNGFCGKEYVFPCNETVTVVL